MRVLAENDANVMSSEPVYPARLVNLEFARRGVAPPGLSPTKEGTLEFFRVLLAAFPDLRVDVEDLLASGDKTVARLRGTATRQGEFTGLPPTGKRVDIRLIDIMRFNDACSYANTRGPPT
jgi:hypothetical protein